MVSTQRSGVRIRYDDEGQGEPALLLMPGWCDSRAQFRALAERLARHHRVLTMDFRGHGESEKPRDDFGFDALVADALAVIEESGARHVVPLPVSHAGWVAVELRRRIPDRIPRLVLLDWIVIDPPQDFLEALDALQDPAAWQATRDALFQLWLEDVTDPEIDRFVREDMGAYPGEMWTRAGREIQAAYAREGTPLEAISRLSPPPPTLHLYAQPPDLEYLETQREFAKNHPWFDVRRLSGRSHFPMLEVPGEIAEAVEAFLKQG